MSEDRWLWVSERLLGFLLRLYPADFREEVGPEVVAAYDERCRAAFRQGGVVELARVWLRAVGDSIRNGLGERLRPAVVWRRGGNWGRDAERVVRRLARAPVFTLTMFGTLVVGLGAFAVVYAVVDKVLIERLPYENPDDLYVAWRNYTWLDLDRGWLGGPDIDALDAESGVIQDVAGLRREMVTLGSGAAGEPQEVAAMQATPNLFDLLGVHPVLGRGFAPDEVGPGRAPVVVLTDNLWRGRFGSDPAILGSEIRLNGAPYTVIGVMGPEFRFVRHSSLGPPQGADLYTTFDYDLTERHPYEGSWAGLIRARPGTPSAVVAAAVAAVGRRLDERDFGGRGLRLYSVGMKPDLVARVRPAVVALGLAGVFLVLVLAVNLATLLLARAAQREREFAISRALGASGPALVRVTLLEGGLLGMLGGVGGVLAAIWGTRVLVAFAPLEIPQRESIAVDVGVAAVVVGTGAVLGLLAAIVPATWAARTRLAALLGAAAVRGGGGHGRLRRGMVVVQVALTLVLLSAGGLVVRSFDRLLRSEPGFEAAGVLTFRVPVTNGRYPDAAAVLAVHERIHTELAALPGVRVVGAASALPLTADASQMSVYFPGAPGNTGDEDRDAPLIDHIGTRPGYFKAMGIPVLAGRTFRTTAADGVREAVIGRILAARFFPVGDPIGATLVFGDDSLTVVGVAEHARMYDLHRDDRPQVYLREDYRSYDGLSWALRTERAPSSLVPEVRAAIRRIDPELALADVRSMEQVVSESLRQPRLSATLIAGFGLGALLLAAMGLFGVVAGSVTRRRHELAVRLALGAEHSGVLRLVVGEGARLVVLGLLLGGPGIYLSARVIRGTLVGVSPFDPLTLGAVACGLGIVTLAACYLPARRVLGIEPARLLRQE